MASLMSSYNWKFVVRKFAAKLAENAKLMFPPTTAACNSAGLNKYSGDFATLKSLLPEVAHKESRCAELTRGDVNLDAVKIW